MSPFVFVLFGATGDLAQHKLFPALFNLYKQGVIGGENNKIYIIGFARRSFSDSEYATMIAKAIGSANDPQWESFAKHIYYQQGYFDQIDGYNALIPRLSAFDKEIGACITRLFYLAVPPDNYENILNFLSETKLSEGCGQGSEKWTRIAIEKPFGKNLETAWMLDKKLADIFEEHQIYRVDHYLGKETVQNMLAFRFANSMFEPVWNHNYIDHVQLTWAEKGTVSTRGSFFDGVGMLRDVMQNHLMQIMTTVTMEQPRSFTKESVRDERARAIKAIKPFGTDIKESIIRAQYNGYLQEKEVSPTSRTDTYIAMKLFVDTPRFEGVPFYLRAGKAMSEDLVDIKVVFKQTCQILFKEYGCPEVGNVLTIRIQPDEGITLRIIAKDPEGKPGKGLTTADMHFGYNQSFGGKGIDAYERILLDILKGDQMLFNRSDELAYSWEIISSILTYWQLDATPMPLYEIGSSGPEEANALIVKDNRKWL